MKKKGKIMMKTIDILTTHARAMEVCVDEGQYDDFGRPLLVMTPVEGFPSIILSKEEEQEALDFLQDAIAYRERNPL